MASRLFGRRRRAERRSKSPADGVPGAFAPAVVYSRVVTAGAQPLENVTVIDLGQIYQGAYTSFLLAMAGARVIKMEPIGGERLRGRADTPPTLAFAMLNSNKLGVTLDLKQARGRELPSTPENNPRVGRSGSEVLRRRTRD